MIDVMQYAHPDPSRLPLSVQLHVVEKDEEYLIQYSDYWSALGCIKYTETFKNDTKDCENSFIS